MIKDDFRGHNWTNALLGIKAKEVHLCGDERALNLIKNLLEKTGDSLEVHEYERLSKLTVQKQEFEQMTGLEDGDCIIAFSKDHLHRLKK